MTYGETHVPWKFKDWKDYSDEDKKGLAGHLLKMDKHKRLDYIRYLGSHCGAPVSSLLDYVKKEKPNC